MRFNTRTELRKFLVLKGFNVRKLTVGYHGMILLHPLWLQGEPCAEIEKRDGGYKLLLFKKYV